MLELIQKGSWYINPKVRLHYLLSEWFYEPLSGFDVQFSSQKIPPDPKYQTKSH